LGLGGCVTEVINRADPAQIKLQYAQFDYEKQEHLRERLEKKRMAGKVRIERLRAVRLKQKEFLRQEDNLILKSFQGSGIILKAFSKLGCSMFDIAGFLNEYGKNDMDGFCDYLKTRHPFTARYEWWLDESIFIPAKRNYELIIRLKGCGYDYKQDDPRPASIPVH
jgi:hypothetical protein